VWLDDRLDLEKRLRVAAHASVNAVTVPEPPASLRLLRADVARRRTSGWLWTAAAAAAVALTVATYGGRSAVVAQASGVVRAAYAHLFIFQGSSKRLQPLIHRADRLTIAQAHRHLPFAIVVPAGLPPHTIFNMPTWAANIRFRGLR
jgi:UDP-N-acetyl-D-mannosaminuronic acid transferase (WecB/TagA/CpsF family)